MKYVVQCPKDHRHRPWYMVKLFDDSGAKQTPDPKDAKAAKFDSIGEAAEAIKERGWSLERNNIIPLDEAPPAYTDEELRVGKENYWKSVNELNARQEKERQARYTEAEAEYRKLNRSVTQKSSNPEECDKLPVRERKRRV